MSFLNKTQLFGAFKIWVCIFQSTHFLGCTKCFRVLFNSMQFLFVAASHILWILYLKGASTSKLGCHSFPGRIHGTIVYIPTDTYIYHKKWGTYTQSYGGYGIWCIPKLRPSSLKSISLTQLKIHAPQLWVKKTSLQGLVYFWDKYTKHSNALNCQGLFFWVINCGIFQDVRNPDILSQHGGLVELGSFPHRVETQA